MSGKVALKVSPIKRIGGRRTVMKMIEEDLARQTDILVVDHIDRGYKEPPVPREFCNIALPSSSYLHQQQDSHRQANLPNVFLPFSKLVRLHFLKLKPKPFHSGRSKGEAKVSKLSFIRILDKVKPSLKKSFS